MKVATCNQLRGACDEEFAAETPEQMGMLSRAHVEKMLANGDPTHQEAVESMQKLTKEEQQAWYQDFVNSFDSLPNKK